jgi:putative membrane protein
VLLRLAVRLVLLGLIILLVGKIVPGIHVYGGIPWAIWLALILSVINLFVGTILRLISLPLIILTLGLFMIVVNAAVLEITAAASSHLDITNFGDALVGAILISLFSWIGELLLPARLSDRKRGAR